MTTILRMIWKSSRRSRRTPLLMIGPAWPALRLLRGLSPRAAAYAHLLPFSMPMGRWVVLCCVRARARLCVWRERRGVCLSVYLGANEASPGLYHTFPAGSLSNLLHLSWSRVVRGMYPCVLCVLGPVSQVRTVIGSHIALHCLVKYFFINVYNAFNLLVGALNSMTSSPPPLLCVRIRTPGPVLFPKRLSRGRRLSGQPPSVKRHPPSVERWAQRPPRLVVCRMLSRIGPPLLTDSHCLALCALRVSR